MRLFGKDSKSDKVDELGNDWFLDEIRCCIGYHQMGDLASIIRRRREIASQYAGALEGVNGISLLKVPQENYPSYYQFPVFLNQSVERKDLIESLKNKYGITTKGIYRPCHQEKVFSKYDDSTLRQTEETLNRSLCLPIFGQLSELEVQYVTDSLVNELKSRI